MSQHSALRCVRGVIFSLAEKREKESRWVPSGSSAELQMLDLSSETDYWWEEGEKNERVSNGEAASAERKNN